MENYIINSIMSNVSVIAMMFGVFSLCVISDLLAKTFYNTHRLGENFDWRKFLTGWVRLIIVGVSTAMLGIVISILPDILVIAGIEITEELKALITVASICLIYLNGIIKYFKSAYDTINKIINNEKLFDENIEIS